MFPTSKYIIIFWIIALVSPINAMALSAGDNLGAWRMASYSERLDLSNKMIQVLNKDGRISASDAKVLGLSVSNCINETAGDGGIDYMKISETAISCIAIISNQ